MDEVKLPAMDVLAVSHSVYVCMCDGGRTPVCSSRVWWNVPVCSVLFQCVGVVGAGSFR